MAKIGILHYSCPPVRGGVEEIIRHHTRLLVEHGHTVRVIAGQGKPFNPDAEFAFISEASSNPTGSPEQLRAVLRENLPLDDLDIIIAHNIFTMPFNLGLTWALWEMAFERPTIAWCHDAAYLDPTYHLPPPDREPYSFLAKAHPQAVYVAISEYRKRVIGELLGTDMLVVPDGIEVAETLGLPAEIASWAREVGVLDADLVALSPVRLTPRKNLELAIGLVGEMNRAGEKTFLLITGPGDPHNPSFAGYRDILASVAREYGAGDRVRFLAQEIGDLPNLVPLFLLSDFLLLTSRMEGFGLPAIEAAMFRMPAVLSDIPPLREIAGGLQTALFVDLETDLAVGARCVLDFLNAQPSLVARKRTRERFGWNSIYANHIEPLLRDILS